jgi:sulfur transfer complex TusBCD TusB component (DsrH family)
VVLRLPGGREVRATTDEAHESQLTRETVTAAVHYLRFDLSAEDIDAFQDGVVLAIDHPAYDEEIELLPATVSELRRDLLPDPA